MVNKNNKKNNNSSNSLVFGWWPQTKTNKGGLGCNRFHEQSIISAYLEAPPTDRALMIIDIKTAMLEILKMMTWRVACHWLYSVVTTRAQNCSQRTHCQKWSCKLRAVVSEAIVHKLHRMNRLCVMLQVTTIVVFVTSARSPECWLQMRAEMWIPERKAIPWREDASQMVGGSNPSADKKNHKISLVGTWMIILLRNLLLKTRPLFYKLLGRQISSFCQLIKKWQWQLLHNSISTKLCSVQSSW